MCNRLRYARIGIAVKQEGEMRAQFSQIVMAILVGSLLGGISISVAIAEVAGHVVISEIQTDSINGTGGTGDDWIELYNPTAADIDLAGWHLGRDSNGGNSLNDETEIASGTITSHGYFLIVSASATPSLKALADAEWTGLTFDDGDVLYLAQGDITNSNPQGDIDVIDILGLQGCSPSTDAEGDSPAPNPPEEQSIQRKVNSTIDEDGIHGPAWDTDSNSADFFIQTSPNPQNSSEAGPIPPIPELPVIILLSLGLLALGGCIWLNSQTSPNYNRAC